MTTNVPFPRAVRMALWSLIVVGLTSFAATVREVQAFSVGCATHVCWDHEMCAEQGCDICSAFDSRCALIPD